MQSEHLHAVAACTKRWDVIETRWRNSTDPALRAALLDPAALQRRRQMVDQQLVARDIIDTRVLDAMHLVPREWFLPDRLRHAAYDDGALPVAEGQTISQPYIVALMTQALRLAPHHRVLEIGTGTGYQTAILALLAGRIDTVERIASLAEDARRRLQTLGVENVRAHVGDGTLGMPQYAPFDRIIVTAGSPHVPRSLLDQLADDGRMVIPIGEEGFQELIALQKKGGGLAREHLTPCRFVRLVGEEGWRESA